MKSPSHGGLAGCGSLPITAVLGGGQTEQKGHMRQAGIRLGYLQLCKSAAKVANPKPFIGLMVFRYSG